MEEEHKGEFTVALATDLGTITLDAGEIKQFYYIEDIFSYCMVGKIVFLDSRGIFEFGPLTGNERVILVYGEDEDIELNFKIYKVNRVDQMSNTVPEEEVIELFFAEDMFFIMNFYQYSRAWKDTKISDIVNHITTHHLGIDKKDKWETTNEKLPYFYIPYWNLNTTINWLCKRATGENSGEPGYCFYINPQGANFVTLETLLSDPDDLGVGDNLYVFHAKNEIAYNKILSWSISGVDLSAVRQLSGGITWGYNSLEKQFKRKEYEYSRSSARQTILGEKTLFPDISEKRAMHKNVGETTEENLDIIYHNNWNKRYAHQQILSITCRGHEDRYCGGQIEINWPSGDKDEQYNKHLHGKYLVKSITHSFNGDRTPAYRQKLILIKNGYEESFIDSLYDSSKKLTV